MDRATRLLPTPFNMLHTRFFLLQLFCLCLFCVTGVALAQPAGHEFPVGSLSRIDQLPVSKLRTRLNQLPPAAQKRALQWLQSFHFTELDLDSLKVDSNGGILYADTFKIAEAPAPSESPSIAQAAVPVSPFPSGLIFHSRRGSANVLFLNFCGETVSNTEWNNVVGRTVIPAMAFSTDSDYTTFSDAEQVAIKRVWERVAEDYAPFDIDVTTERPATFNNRIAQALITRTTDANGAANPYSDSGGVAYVNMFNTTSYSKYRPAWIYQDNLANAESFIAEAASHEIGHNLGLSHDGTTDGNAYYGGHGSSDTSWGPLMGTGYNRNVSQWSKGEYYLANNTQDDLAIIAGKISYRGDDHGNTASAATALTLTGGTNIVSTTPETDPANTNSANKGVFERGTDVDVFSFITGSGSVRLNINPWIMPSGTRGGNLDVMVELRDEAGNLLLTNNPATQTIAVIQTNLTEGRYYLHVKNAGAGNPFSSTPTGYTPYGSIGQYFISGYIVAPTVFVAPPIAELQITDITSGEAAKQFSVTYSDNVAVNVSTIDSNDIRVVGPNGYDVAAQFVSLNVSGNGTPRVATYSIAPPSANGWSPADNGTYTVLAQTNQVGDTEGAWLAAGQLGQFQVSVAATIYSANMNTDPGWTLEPQWQYGAPNYTGTGPTSGFTGANIIGYNLSGNYEDRLSATYATTPPINCSSASSLTLRFQRWLKVKSGDTASIQVSTDGNNWMNVWTSSGTIADENWQSVQYTLPAGVAGSSTVRLRWALSSNPAQNDIGWNLDDVELLGDGTLDTTPPVASLNVADQTLSGSSNHPCSVTYTDDTAVRLASLGSTDLLVTGPNGYSNLVTLVGADLPGDGSPLTASYSIPAPGGSWDSADNGSYDVVLLANEVEDVLNNTIPQTTLGSFTVAIASPGLLGVSPGGGFNSSGLAGGPFNPSSFICTLTNGGESSLVWSADKSQNWLDLSFTAGTLAPGEVTNVTVSINTNADSLSPGSYTGALGFTNVTTGVGLSRPVNLIVNGSVELNVTVNNSSWGSVSPTNGIYAAGSSVELLATPANYFYFLEWSGDVVGSSNPISVTLDTNKVVQAVFAEILTTEHATALWWLAAQGYTNSFETAVDSIGANGLPLWQSYIAGLNPNDPASQLRVSGKPSANGTGYILNWNTVPDRLYTILSSTNLQTGFAPLPGATDLPATIQSFTNTLDGAAPGQFYRIDVRKP
jgi:hypothetical protein